MGSVRIARASSPFPVAGDAAEIILPPGTLVNCHYTGGRKTVTTGTRETLIRRLDERLARRARRERRQPRALPSQIGKRT